MRTLILFVAVTLLTSCNTASESSIDVSDFQNKTYQLVYETLDDTLNVEFIDTTYILHGKNNYEKLPWRISNFDSRQFLVFDNKAIGITSSGEGIFNCTYIGSKDIKVKMIERKKRWDKNALLGKWMKKSDHKNYLYFKNNPKSKPPPLPRAIDDSTNAVFVGQGYYSISEDSIRFYKYYRQDSSAYKINNTNEFLSMQLSYGEDMEKNTSWEIKTLTEKYMIVKRYTRNYEDFSYKNTIDTLVMVDMN